MDEFIVLDKYEEEFLDAEGISISSFGTIIECYPDEEVFNVLSDEDRYTTHRLIKTDDTPEQNKIYADCSIVEFDFKDKKLQGLFRYSKMRLSYVIEDMHNDMGEMVYDGLQTNFKVIGTLQKDKHLSSFIANMR